jgi:hypothetical protein
MLRIPLCLENLLTDGSEFVRLTRRALPTPRYISVCRIHFYSGWSTMLQAAWLRIRQPMRWLLSSIYLPNPSGRARPWGVVSLLRKWVTETELKMFLRRRALSMSRLCRQCGIIKTSESYRPPRPVTDILLLVSVSCCILSLLYKLWFVNFLASFFIPFQNVTLWPTVNPQFCEYRPKVFIHEPSHPYGTIHSVHPTSKHYQQNILCLLQHKFYILLIHLLGSSRNRSC